MEFNVVKNVVFSFIYVICLQLFNFLDCEWVIRHVKSSLEEDNISETFHHFKKNPANSVPCKTKQNNTKQNKNN